MDVVFLRRPSRSIDCILAMDLNVWEWSEGCLHSQWAAVGHSARGETRVCLLDDPLEEHFALTKRWVTKRRKPLAFSNPVLFCHGSTSVLRSTQGTRQSDPCGLAGSCDPNLLPTQAQYKWNNQLTGGSARPRPHDRRSWIGGPKKPPPPPHPPPTPCLGARIQKLKKKPKHNKKIVQSAPTIVVRHASTKQF